MSAAQRSSADSVGFEKREEVYRRQIWWLSGIRFFNGKKKKKKMVSFFHSQAAVISLSRKSVIYWNSCAIIEFSLSGSCISNWLQTVFDVPASWTHQGQTFASVLMDGFTALTALLPSPGCCPHVQPNFNQHLCAAQVLFEEGHGQKFPNH